MGAPPKAVTAACSIHSFIQSCIEAWVRGRCNGGSPKGCDSSLKHAFIHSFIQSLMSELIHLSVRPSVHPSICPFIHPFIIYPFTHLLTHSLTHSFTQSCTCSFIHSKWNTACWLQIITMTACTASAHDKCLIQAAPIHIIAETLTVKAGLHRGSYSGQIKIDNNIDKKWKTVPKLIHKWLTPHACAYW